MSAVVSAVNSLGSAVFGSVSTFLTLNYVVGGAIAHIVLSVASSLASLAVAAAKAVEVVLEDLLVFFREIADIFVNSVEFVFALIDGVVAAIVAAALAVRSGICFTFSSVASAASSAASAVAAAGTAVGGFVTMLGASLVLLAQLVPRTMFLIGEMTVKSALYLYFFGLNGVRSMHDAFRNAPIEMFLGLVVSAIVGYSAVRLSVCLVRSHRVTPTLALSTAFRVVAFLYLNFVRGVIVTLGALLHVVAVMLSHAHVPRFHHAGDSDAEDEAEEDNSLVEVGDSDTEDRQREAQKRRNYDLLLKRRQSARSSRAKRGGGGGGEEVEDMLFEQVEREREDKLCVICQDREKCIMILPCRHLCVCQDCQRPLLQQQPVTCPICRRAVRQTIKAYL